MTNTPVHSQEDVLLSFSAEPDHGPATLQAYVQRFPEYSAALAELAVELMLAPARNVEVCATHDAAVDRAWQIFQTSAAPLETKNRGSAVISLPTLAQADFRALAKRIGANTLLLAQVRDRLIEATTIPRRFLERLAQELSTTVDDLIEYLDKPPVVAPGARFKSDTKPEVEQRISFKEAVEGSGLSEMEKARLHSDAD